MIVRSKPDTVNVRHLTAIRLWDATDGDISNLAIEVKEIGVFKAIGTVTFTNNGKPDKILVELQRSNKDWRIVDITWEFGSLRDAFRRKASYKGDNLPH